MNDEHTTAWLVSLSLQLTRMARREAIVIGATLAPNWACFSGADPQEDPAEETGLHPGLQQAVATSPGEEKGLHPGLQQEAKTNGAGSDGDIDDTGLQPGLQQSAQA
jgi:hypothetical protein